MHLKQNYVTSDTSEAKMNVVQEAKYIMSNVEGNNNKYWYIFRYDNHKCITKNGRVGATKGDEHEFDHDSEEAAIKFFNAKCREKDRKGYKKLDVIAPGAVVIKTVSASANLSEVAKKQIEYNSPDTAKLIERLSKANTHNILESTTMQYNVDTGLFSTPCGIVSQDTLDKARDLLVVMSDYVKNADFRNKKYINNLEEYLMLIPQKVGRKLDPESLYTSLADIRKQNDILDSLNASLTTALSSKDSTNPVEVEQKLFSCKLFKNEDDRVMKRLKDKFRKTLKRGHECAHLDIKTIFDVEIKVMKDAFEKHGTPLGNIQELWHGTRIFNVLSILKGGLQIPKKNASNVTGAMFGPGVYFSDISSKSLNYSYGYWDGKKRDQNCFMVLADVAMGKSYIPHSSYETLPKKGYDSTFAKPGQSGIQNNEMIVYNTNQCNINYLIEFSPDGK